MSEVFPMRIAAVFATMNRRDTALECVRRLAAQSRPPDEVRIADNGSQDGTVEALEGLSGLPFSLHLVRMPENLGNAGGIERVMEAAFDAGADAVWILDDDSLPRPEALAALTGSSWTGETVRHPLQIDPGRGGFTWPMQVADGAGGWSLVEGESGLPDAEVFETKASWTGALVPRSVREAAGPVKGELFIRGEDEEYPLRIARAGRRFEAVKTAKLDHPAPKQLRRMSLFGRHFFVEPGLSGWKLYYKVRNMVWIKRTYFGAGSALAMSAAYVIGVARIDGLGAGRLGVLSRALRDAWCGRLGPMPRSDRQKA